MNEAKHTERERFESFLINEKLVVNLNHLAQDPLNSETYLAYFVTDHWKIWQHQAAIIANLERQLSEAQARYIQVSDDWNHEAKERKEKMRTLKQQNAELREALNRIAYDRWNPNNFDDVATIAKQAIANSGADKRTTTEGNGNG